MNDMTANKIIKTIYQMIDRWEPRISIIDIPIIADEENNTYSANLDEILNSRRWKLVSKIQLPDSIKKVARKIIK